MSKRYLKVRGAKGILLADPHALHAEPRRYAGQRMTKPDAAEYRDRFEPCEQVIADDPMLRKAITRGEIELLAVGVGADLDSIKWDHVVNVKPMKKVD